MRTLSVTLLAVLGAAVVGIASGLHCDCRPAANCPQAYWVGSPTGCYLSGTRTVGVCCPRSGTPTHSTGGGQGFSRGHSGRLQQGQTGSSGFRQGGSGGSAQSANTHRLSGGSHQIPSSGYGTPSTSYGTPSTGYLTPSTDYGVPKTGDCRPLVLCPPLVASPESLYSNGCTLADGSPGIICTFSGVQLASVDVATRSSFSSSSSSSSAVQGLSPMLSAQSFVEQPIALQAAPEIVQRAQGFARQASSAVAFAGNQLASSGQAAAADSPTELFNFNALSTPEAQNIGLQALQSLETIINLAVPGNGAGSANGAGLANSAGFSGQSQRPGQGNFQSAQGNFQSAQGNFQSGQGGPVAQSSQTTSDPTCVPEPPVNCPNTLYRSITGECNNLQNPRLGRALTGFKRLLPNTFDDGIFAVRTRATRGGTLPTARFISERILDVFSNELRHHTLSLMQIGQFVDHDFTHALIFKLPNNKGIECCLDEGRTFPTNPLHPQCIPIPIPVNDPFYSQFQQRCMNLVRSLPAPSPDCVARPARPLNELTAFIDGSNVYGSSQAEVNNLRAFSNGLLRESTHRLLPLDQRPDKPCRRNTCYHAGDTRVNEQSLLAVIHTVWMREHNRIAGDLQARHPQWGDERLYQEARRILVAEWQHILYNEWLPVLIGFQYSDAHGLLPLQSGYSFHYDPRIDPGIANSFATAAMRFGHTMVRDMYDTLDANGIITGRFNLSSTFFDPGVIANGITEHARTMVAMRSETFDTFFARSLHEHLFTTNHLWGLDLLALNIQRGRDHGTPTYAHVVEACGLVPAVRFWADLNPLMNGDVIDRLRFVYDDPRDVDLFIGGVGERIASGAQVGPTFQCLIGQQFFDLRYGDRFFYDNGNQPHSFSPPQLAQIRRSNWARILCDTLGPNFQNDFRHVQPLAILTPGGQNQQVSCDSLAIPRVDLSVF